jgi:putative copper resistance protein D
VLSRWGLLVLRTVYDIGGMATIGVLVVGVVVVPAAAVLSDDALRLVRTAGRWAAVWASAGALSVPLVLSDVTGLPVWKVLAPDVLALAPDLPQTRALMSSAWLAALVAVGARRCESVAMGRLLLVTGLGALLPLLLTGHTGHGDLQVVAMLGLATHVTAASVWLGGLLAMGVYLRSAEVLAVALPRYSRVALGCFTLVALSGVVMGWVALTQPSDVVTTPYGRLLLAKAAVLGVLGLLGHWHRRRTLPAVAAWRPRAFVTLAAVELVVMAAAAGLAVGLSRTAPPDGADHAASVVSTTIDARGIPHVDLPTL